MADKPKSIYDISIRLHTSQVKQYQDVLKSKYQVGGKQPLQKNLIPKEYGHAAAFSIFDQHSRPQWASKYEELVGRKALVPDNRYSNAVVVFRITSTGGKTRFMSLTFGYGQSLLDSTKMEPDFGRSIAAQKIPDSGVSSAGTIQISDAIIQMEKQYTGTRSGGIEQLVTSSSEFPSNISGRVNSGAVETLLNGGGSLLKAKRLMRLDEISDDLRNYLDAYLNPSSLADWATRLMRVESGGLKETLNSKLMIEMIAGGVDYSIAWPTYQDVNDLTSDILKIIPQELVPEEQLMWYIDRQKAKNEEYSTGQLLSKLKTAHLVAVDSDGRKFKKTLYECLSAALVYKKKRYLLFTGTWYEVAEKFYDDLLKKIRSIQLYEKDLPSLGTALKDGEIHDEAEGHYNKRLATFVKDGVLFDKKDFNNRKGSEFSGLEEPADVITKRKELFFVKKGGSSAMLSHLFLQGLVSARLLARDGDSKLRDFINDKFDAKKRVFSEDVMNSDVTLIFVIIKDKQKLPFFSMVSFSGVVDSLREMGYKVKLAWVSKS